MKTLANTALVFLITALSFDASAYVYRNGNEKSTANLDSDTRAAQCAPATGLNQQAWNNVRTIIETGGSMWQDRQNGRAAYEIPKGGGVSSIFSGGLWMGGMSPDQTLKLAAVRFRQGNDFWPGPLTNDGTAEVSAATCVEYDKFMVTLRQDSERHRLWFDMQANGSTQEQIDAVFPDGYSRPAYFDTYMAHGNTALLQDYYLAPFYNYDDNEEYDPAFGDYPWYDFLQEIDCSKRKREDIIPLFGDQTYYWIFNDKGNIHTESGGNQIGMEIRAQAFAFTSNDEINNMTFLNYVLINQGTQRLTETYFGSFVDPDLGAYNDDYVGCDVQRGLGYCYNGQSVDNPVTGSMGYGDYLPAVGIDFFEGPYQNADGMDNPLTTNIAEAIAMDGIPYKGLGIGYGDGVVDNERFGMRRFVYFNLMGFGHQNTQDPNQPIHYYNYLRGIWKNNQEMLYGGDGYSSGTVSGLLANYMFPGDSDPYHWGTGGVTPPAGPAWTESNANNAPADRRFVQSAGPFTLEPGDYNNITLGVVWAQATSKNNNLEAVGLLLTADDKAQALFDNCFELVSGPDAPDVTVRELDREIILMLSNENALSNNYQEKYMEFDPAIPEILNGDTLSEDARSYKFEGYKVFQLVDATVSNADLGEISKARLIAQCDVRNGITNIINYDRDGVTGLIVPSLMVQGGDNGIRRSYRITTDAFATTTNTLVNHKTYYFMVIAYGYNEYMPFDMAALTGQDESYKASRKAAIGEVQIVRAIPHSVNPLNGGTVMNSTYGDGFYLRRIEGKGNGQQNVSITAEDEISLLSPPYYLDELHHTRTGSPVEVKVVDPLRIPDAEFELRLKDTLDNADYNKMYWSLKNLTTGENAYDSPNAFNATSEDVILKYGISIQWGQYAYLNSVGETEVHLTDFISGAYQFSNSMEPWLTGIPDADGITPFNWIRAGTFSPALGNAAEKLYADYEVRVGETNTWVDGDSEYEKVLFGMVAPYCLTGFTDKSIAESTPTPPIAANYYDLLNPVAPSYGESATGNADDNYLTGVVSFGMSNSSLHPLNSYRYISSIAGLNNVDLVITPDKSKWTRCPVLEMQPLAALAENNLNVSGQPARKMGLRKHLSVDKNGLTVQDPGHNAEEANLTGTTGMGWFPGYAIDTGTGERLNLAFGEDSWMVGDNGRDMLWNPSSNYTGSLGQPVFGGQHWIYVFKNLRAEINRHPDETLGYCGRYDEGAYIRAKLAQGTTEPMQQVFAACTWVFSAMLNNGFSFKTPQEGLVPSQVRVSLRVAKPYARYAPSGQLVTDSNNSQNDWRNLYRFSTGIGAARLNVAEVKENALDQIRVVPNPYYAFSGYETSKLDNRVKIVNLPEVCTVTIYDLNGTLIRQFKKGDPTSSLDWDLKNHKNIPIASGAYIIHVDVPEVGEKVLKWFGVMRPVDLDNF